MSSVLFLHMNSSLLFKGRRMHALGKDWSGEGGREKQPKGWAPWSPLSHTISFLPHGGPGWTFLSPFPGGNSGSEPWTPEGATSKQELQGSEWDVSGGVTPVVWHCRGCLHGARPLGLKAEKPVPPSQGAKCYPSALTHSNVTFGLSFLFSERPW